MGYKYPVSQPYMKGNELEYVTRAIKDNWISSQGPFVKEFEDKFAQFNGYKHGVACSSGTSALTLALRALNIREGDEVIVPEFTMVACPWAVTYTGAKPVFVDCDENLNMDVSKIEGKITPRTKAIMAVHIYGRKCNMEKITEIAHSYNLRIVEDCAEAHGIKPVGDIACFSLYGNKIISAGEGGICVTNDDHFARQIVHLRAMAFTPDHDFLHKKIAYNYRMTNMQAAVALAQVENITEILEKRKKIGELYDEKLKDIKGLKLLPKRDVVWFYDLLAEKRPELQKFLEMHGIETRQFFKPMSRQPMYYDENWSKLNAAKFGEIGLYLPTYPGLTEDDIGYIANKIKEFYDSNG
tara:strand:- start:8362 stop:9423 length:1062 start_codon:yes stop_codon:yes gene_type:complete